MSKEIFISYSSVNYQEALRLSKDISLMGVSNWLAPNQLVYGPEYSGQITEAIRNASILIVLISRDSMKSHQVLNEIALATEFKKEIIAYRLDDEPLNDSFKYYLVARHWVDAGTDRLTAMTKLTHLIRELRSAQSENPKSKEVLEAERNGTEVIYMVVRVGVVMVTLVAWLIITFLLHNIAYGTPLYSIGILAASFVEIILIIVILGPIFGGAGKFAKTILKGLFDAFRGK